jgi:hypothetical protein
VRVAGVGLREGDAEMKWRLKQIHNVSAVFRGTSEHLAEKTGEVCPNVKIRLRTLHSLPNSLKWFL